VLEGVLSIDKALVLGLLVKRLPKHQQKKSLTYGLAEAFTFRIIAISAASFLLKRHVVKLLGGGYLLWVAVKHFWDNCGKQKDAQAATLAGETSTPTLVAVASFWPTAVVIELTDVAFAVDSVLAAIALVGPPPVVNDLAVT